MGKLIKCMCEKCEYEFEYIDGGTKSVELITMECKRCQNILDKIKRFREEYSSPFLDKEMLGLIRQGIYFFELDDKKTGGAKKMMTCDYCNNSFEKKKMDSHIEFHIKDAEKKMKEWKLKEKKIVDSLFICSKCSGELAVWDKSGCPKCQSQMKNTIGSGLTIID